MKGKKQTSKTVENAALVGIATLATVALVSQLYQAGYDYGVVEGYRTEQQKRAIESEATEL